MVYTQGMKRGAEASPEEHKQRGKSGGTSMEIGPSEAEDIRGSGTHPPDAIVGLIDLDSVCAIDHCDMEEEAQEDEDAEDPDAPGLNPAKVKAGKDREMKNMEHILSFWRCPEQKWMDH